MKDRLFYKFRKLDKKIFIRILIGLLISVLFSARSIQPAISQGVEIDFGETTVENHFPKGIRFSVKIDVTDERGTIHFHYRLGNEPWAHETANCSAKVINTVVDYYSCVFFLDIPNLPPQLPISYKWRLYGSADRYSEEQTITYEDPRFLWQTLTRGNVTIWWHDHSQEFGERVYSTVERSIQKQEPLFNVELANPIQIVVENSREEYLEWNGQTSYSVRGQAFPSMGVTIQIVELDISDGRMNYWLNDVIPHEISHLYFFQATNRAEADPPKWLDEGLARYNEFNNHRYDWNLVRNAARQERLYPLVELREEFRGNDEQVALAYAESLTAAEYLIDTYGEQGFNNLFSAYQDGKTSDEAFQAAFGRTVSEIEADWQMWIKEQSSGSSLEMLILLFFLGIYLGGGCLSIFMLAGLIIYFSRKNQPRKSSKGLHSSVKGLQQFWGPSVSKTCQIDTRTPQYRKIKLFLYHKGVKENG